ncbi:membrane protein insertase YidC [Lysobacter enzymogenes]|uniref:Membrane protein insertase YidC n=1 Tax=Lysobacter enzymogenes TaxID=69 RepID=A0A3N2RMI8_LYSEN|nr:membrane protein insertase YidC [Lysobacter enzymogenes]ROU08658.1 membrane protein insertase YidC [Lysobacter enzymogenes]
MNQTRAFLILAWLMVATLLWMEWGKEKSAPPVAPPSAVAPASSVPSVAGLSATPGVPAAPAAAPSAPAASPGIAAAAPSDAPVVVSTDVFKVILNGGEISEADLLRYPVGTEPNSPPMRLLAHDSTLYFVAQSGWVNQAKIAPTHDAGFRYAGDSRELKIADGAKEIAVPFVWTGADGVTITRTYTFRRGDYVIKVRDEVANASAAPWQGYIYRQLSRVPRELARKGPFSPEQYSFQGAAWYSPTDKYEKRKYDKFAADGNLNKQVTGGWIAMLQHHFFAAWIPGDKDQGQFQLDQLNAGGAPQYVIRDVGPGFTVAPGQKVSTEARLWVGPKLVKAIEAQGVQGLDRAVDFSSYSIFATLANGLFWLLDKLHGLFGNWGWAIIGLVVLLKLALYPLSAAQYKSQAKMRKFQPRVAQLKERYGDDKQKFQMALMELYKKEKINPVGGCLPVLPSIIIFMTLYWMLAESVELRHAPWTLWIHDLTSRDPFFVLPLCNIAIMWATQKLTPMTGMDPTQQKMMQFMPLVFGVILAFLPAGLVLYQVANGGLGLLQQWITTKRYAEENAAGGGGGKDKDKDK